MSVQFKLMTTDTTKQSAIALGGRYEHLYLDLLRVSPGDVLLTLGRKPQSRAIAALSDGEFSHAAIILEKSLLFESDGNGVGQTWLPWSRIEVVKGTLSGVLCELPHHPRKAIVLRHLETPKRDDVAGLLQEVCDVFEGLEYPQIEELANTLEPTTRKARIALAVARTLSSARPPPGKAKVLSRGVNRFFPRTIVPGPFCSQLVAEVYKALNIFPAATITANVSPQWLFKEPKMEPVMGAVRRRDRSAALPRQDLVDLRNKELEATWILKDREHSVSPLVALNALRTSAAGAKVDIGELKARLEHAKQLILSAPDQAEAEFQAIGKELRALAGAQQGLLERKLKKLRVFEELKHPDEL